jgi:retron-type reverse transcriptase
MNYGSDEYYDIYFINKNNSDKKRLIQKPSDKLKQKQKDLISLYSKFPLHSACACAKGLGPLYAATPHLEAKYLLKIDISNCFENINLDKVYKAISRASINSLLKETMIKNLSICFIHWNQKTMLPTGSPTSPILCNIALSHIDKLVTQIASNNDYVYTRYMDDLNLSTKKETRDWILIDQIKHLLESENYPINHKKTKWYGRGDNDAKIVAGINLQTVSRREIKRLVRARLNNLAKENKPLDSVTQGYLAYIKSIDENNYKKLTDYFIKRKNYNQPKEQI